MIEDYLKQASLAHTLPRMSECLVLRRFKLEPPVLDVGCGEGVFSRICLGKEKIDVGLDPDEQAVRLAEKSGGYKRVVVSGAEKMPFKDGSFKTVISNSVLEHIEDVEGVFKEVRRVLKTGGRFILLVPDKKASEYFFYALVLEKLRLKRLAKGYIRFKNRLYRYVHLEKREFWEVKARKAGFKVEGVTGFISPTMVKWIDFLSPLALADYVLRKAFGRSFVFRPEFIARWLAKLLVKQAEEVEKDKATGWCFELSKA
jgi:ubiquinone/menaquinone biosynthesis C-methylase UbiE